jgi:hypothetical protein
MGRKAVERAERLVCDVSPFAVHVAADLDKALRPPNARNVFEEGGIDETKNRCRCGDRDREA